MLHTPGTWAHYYVYMGPAVAFLALNVTSKHTASQGIEAGAFVLIS